MDQASPLLQAKLELFRELWKQEDAKTALDMFNAGKTYTEIGLVFNKTRGSIAGLINRFRRKGLVEKRPQNTNASVRRPQAPELVIANKYVPNVSVSSRTLPPPRRIRLHLVEENQEVTFAELERHHCKWPLGDPKLPDFKFCGCLRIEGKPYCAGHVDMASGRLNVPQFKARYCR